MDLSFYEFFLLEEDFPNYTFGVEIEVPLYHTKEGIDRDAVMGQAVKSMQLGWKWTVDQTCMPGVEIVCSPNPITSDALGALESDVEHFKQTIEAAGMKVFDRPSRCATHFHIGGLDMDTKIKIAELWTKGGVQDMGNKLISPDRKQLMDGDPRSSYMRRVSSINQYQTLPHRLATTKAGKMFQKIGNWLLNTISLDKYGKYDKFYSMSPRGGLGTLEFRTKETTLDGKELSTIVRMIAALAASTDQLYGQMQQQPLQSGDVRRAMYQHGVGPHDIAHVMRNAAGRTNTNVPRGTNQGKQQASE